MLLQPYLDDMEIVYRPGKKMVMVDPLSRAKYTENAPECVNERGGSGAKNGRWVEGSIEGELQSESWRSSRQDFMFCFADNGDDDDASLLRETGDLLEEDNASKMEQEDEKCLFCEDVLLFCFHEDVVEEDDSVLFCEDVLCFRYVGTRPGTARIISRGAEMLHREMLHRDKRLDD
jgi:hypothetical protein